FQSNGCDVVQWQVAQVGCAVVRQRYGQICQSPGAAANLLRQTYQQRKASVAFIDLPGLHASNCCFNEALNIGDLQSHHSHVIALGLNTENGQAAELLHAQVGGASDGRQQLGNLFPDAGQL